MKGNVEYILHVWEEEPEDKSNLPFEYWEAHVKDAPYIPKIGESLYSSDGFEDCNTFRIFDVRNRIGSQFAMLTDQGKSKVNEMQIRDREDYLPVVFAYKEN